MQKVVTIHLNGNVYALEEPAYESLRKYLDQAQARLGANPDRAEIIADLEQAIAEKCLRFFGPRKTVVLASEMDTILTEMGPVESADEPESSKPADVKHPGMKRLYQIREGAMLTGVCNGIAAYFDIDVTLVRISFVVLAFITFGVAVLVYIALAFIIPYADTSEDRAAAYGFPFNAQELIEQVKRHHARFRERHDRQQQAWFRGRRARHRYRRNMGRLAEMSYVGTGPPLGYAARAFMGGVLPLFAIASAAAFVVWVLAVISLVGTQTLFGWPLPVEIPLWAGIIILTIVYAMVTGPLHAVSHGAYGGAWHALHGIVWLGFSILFFWYAYEHLPQARALLERLPELWQNVTSGSLSV